MHRPSLTAPIASATAAPSSLLLLDLGHETQMQLVDRAEYVGRPIGDPAVFRRAVPGFVDRNVVQPREHPLQRDPSLGARERGTGAGVDTPAEGQMLFPALAADDELL